MMRLRWALAGCALAALAGCGGGRVDGNDDGEAAEPAPAWTPPGGSATLPVNPSRPFLQFAPGIDVAETAGVSQGRELFLAEWQAAPGPRPLLDGLGPLFNAGSCATCHVSNGRAAVLGADGSTTPAILFRIGRADGAHHPVYGSQLQSFSTAGEGEGTVRWQASATRPGAIDYVATVSGGPLGDFRLGPRIPPQLVGTGLLDLVPQEQLLERADPDDADGDGVSGRPHWVVEEGMTRIGRFGWKAINATLRTQNAGALHQDMGLTTPVNPQENCTAAQTVCATQPNGGTPEVSDEALTAIVDFMTVLAVPDRRIADQSVFDQGARLFDSVGCAACHRPTLTTGTSTRFPSLSNQKIYPYTDLLLHDMGEELADGVKELDASASEWRTPPLWGLGLVESHAGARFLHDGRAASLPEAISWHGGEALGARQRYQALTAAQRDALLAFLRGI